MAAPEKDCLNKPIKPIVASKPIDIVLRRCENTQSYFTTRSHAKSKSTELFEKMKLSVPKSHHLLSCIRYTAKKEEMRKRAQVDIPVYRKDNHRTAYTRDISERLFIPEQSYDVKCIDEVHKEFFSVIEGRPIRVHDDIKVYKDNINKYLMTKQQIGYRRDTTIKIETDMNYEQTEYEDTYLKLAGHINNFNYFLHEDYAAAQLLVANAEKIHEKLEAKIIELLGYLNRITRLNNIILNLDTIRRILKNYRTFFLFLAPLYWRELYDENYKSTDFCMEKGQFISKSSEYEMPDFDQDVLSHIDAVIEAAKSEFQNPAPAYMYFKSPEALLYEYRTMEMQCRDYFVKTTTSRVPYILLQRRIKNLKRSIRTEAENSQDYTSILETKIKLMLYNERYMQNKFMKILNESFYDIVASPESLQLKLYVEYVYEQIFGKTEEGHNNLYDPMRALENFYEKYSLLMDGLDIHIINKARKELYAQDRRMMLDAYKAQRELKMFDVMKKSLETAFLPPAKFTRPVFTKYVSRTSLLRLRREEKKQALIAQGHRIKPKPFCVSPEDREYLTNFTSWCEGENPKPYLKFIEEFIKPVFKKDKDLR